jgi:primosomal protein N' (replication factor Y) (superfamily II helicase)
MKSLAELGELCRFSREEHSPNGPLSNVMTQDDSNATAPNGLNLHTSGSASVFYRVAVPSPLRRVFDYLPPKSPPELTRSLITTVNTASAQPGTRVRIPFGARKVTGIILEVVSETDVPRAKLRHADSVLDAEPLFSPELLALLRWAADYYQCPVGEVFAAALPARLRAGEGIEAAQERWHTHLAKAGKEDKSAVESLLSRSPRQLALYRLLLEQGPLITENILLAGFGRPMLRKLQERGLAECRAEAPAARGKFDSSKPLVNPLASALILTAEQAEAVAQITARPQKFGCFLLDGVTGSGKTEVYMRAMAQQLALGRQCLVLIPEIGLTPQTIARFTQRFTCPVVALHSGLNESERLSAWARAREGSAGVIIGTRSALFTPLAVPGLIILDEEHDSSFKQQDGFRYSARDLAVMRAHAEGMPIVLGSATPSLETLQNAKAGKFVHLHLPNSTAAVPRAAMELIDIAERPLQEGFSEAALARLRQHLDNGNQCLVFINRRGYAPVLNCTTCGWSSECDDCISQMTVHRTPPRLRCHHCGVSVALPRTCPHCKSATLDTMGLGTQKAESFLQRQFPNTPIIRVDRDSTRGREGLSRALERVESGEPCILLGTQMLAKGHHFPNITLVVILEADGGLFSADFRGQEQMAQLVTQVAGRAGRAERAGEVLLQTKHAAHETLQALSNESYAQFSQRQLDQRLLASLPPFAHLALLRFDATDPAAAMGFAETAAQLSVQLSEDPRLSVEILGPMPAPMEKRAGRFRVQLQLKSERRGQLQDHLKNLIANLDQVKTPPRLRWSVDVDPQDMI